MSKYAQLADCTDRGLTMVQADLENADAFLDAHIAKLGIDPAEVEPNNLLKNIAVHYGYYCVAIRSGGGQDDTLLEKGDRYRRLYQDELLTLDASTLGIDKEERPGGGLRSIPVFRS